MKVLVSLVLTLAALAAGPSFAQQKAQEPSSVQEQQQRRLDQPGNNAPVWRDGKRGEKNYASIRGRGVDGRGQPPARFLGQKSMVTAGEAWRQFRNGPVTFIGGWIVVFVLIAILVFYSIFGPVKLHDKP